MSTLKEIKERHERDITAIRLSDDYNTPAASGWYQSHDDRAALIAMVERMLAEGQGYAEFFEAAERETRIAELQAEAKRIAGARDLLRIRVGELAEKWKESQAKLKQVEALPEKWRSLIGISVTNSKTDKAVDGVLKDLADELELALNTEQG